MPLAGTITEATLLSADRTAVVLDAAAVAAVVDHLDYNDEAAEPSLTVQLVHPAAVGASAFSAGRVIRVRRGAEAELWTITDRRLSATSGDKPRVRCATTAGDRLSEAVGRPQAGTSDAQLFVTGRSVADTLQVVLNPDRGAPARADGSALFIAGVVDADLDGTAGVQASGAPLVDILDSIAEQVGAVWTDRVVPGAQAADDQIALDFARAPDPSRPAEPVAVLTNRDEDGQPVMTDLVRTDSLGGLVTALLPLAGSEPPATAARAVWAAQAVQTGAQSTVRLPAPSASSSSDGPVVADGHLVGQRLLDVSTGESWGIVASEAPDRVTVDADLTGRVPRVARLVDGNGRGLRSVRHPDLVDRFDVRERPLLLPVSPHPELLAEGGETAAQDGATRSVSTDLSDWTGGLPRGFTTTAGQNGAPTFEQVDGPGEVVSGRFSARVTMPAGSRVYVTRTTDREGGSLLGRPYYSADLAIWVAGRLEAGSASIVLEYLDQNGSPVELARTDFPRKGGDEPDQTLSQVREKTLEFSADRIPAEDPARLELYVEATADAVLLWDAVTAVPATVAQPFSPIAGPVGLWLTAARRLREEARYGVTAWAGQGFDAARFVEGAESVRAGDVVDVSGYAAMDDGAPPDRAFVVRARWTEKIGEPRLELSVDLGRPRRPLQATAEDLLRRRAFSFAPGGGAGGSDVALGTRYDPVGTPRSVPRLPSVIAYQGLADEADQVQVVIAIPDGEGAGSSAYVSIEDESGEAPRQTALVTAEDFAAAQARGDAAVTTTFVVDRGGAFVARAVPQRGGAEGLATTVQIVVDVSAPGTTARSLPAARGLRVQRSPDLLVASWAPWSDGRVRAVSVVVASSPVPLDLVGPRAAVLARPGVSVRRAALGPDSQYAHRPEADRRGDAFRFFVAPLAAGTPGYVAATDPDAALDSGAGYFLAPSGLPVLLPAPA